MWFYYGPWITLECSISTHAVAVGLSSDYLLKAVWLFGSVHKTRCRQCVSKPCPKGRVPSKENKQKYIRYKYSLHPSINLWIHNNKVVSGLGSFAYSVHLGLGLKYIFICKINIGKVNCGQATAFIFDVFETENVLSQRELNSLTSFGFIPTSPTFELPVWNICYSHTLEYWLWWYNFFLFVTSTFEMSNVRGQQQ